LASQDYYRLDFSRLVNNSLVEHSYYMYFDSSYYWLSFSQDFFCRDWPVDSSRYLRINAHPTVGKYLNSAVLYEVDRFIEETAASLNIEASMLDTIADRKIEYFFCESDQRIEQICGHRVKGFLDLPSNDIISSFFPHNHEIVHLLVNIKLRQLPLFTQPLLREGLAVHFGGRWAKAPAALSGLGAFLLREELVSLDSLLTYSGFNSAAGPDIAYPVAGLFSSFLIDRVGVDDFLSLYRQLSGSEAEVEAMTAEEVKAAIGATAELEWPALLDEFAAFIDRTLTEDASFLPGSVRQAKLLIEGAGFSISADDDWLVFEFPYDNDMPPIGSFEFGYDARLVGAGSMLFEEQHGRQTPFDGYRFAIQFDGNEAGLYDYATNHLVGKHIQSLTPSPEYLDGAILRVKVKKILLGESALVFDKHKLLHR
jgi:hypothetical protein